MTHPTPVPYAGIWPALLTPLTPQLGIDIPLFAAHCKTLLAAGCVGVTPFGTTGEGPSFNVTERIAAIDGLIAAGIPAARLLVSTSCAALPDVVALTRHATQAGCFGVLLLPPFFLKGVSDQGIIDTYTQVIEQVADERLRVVLYHIPQVSGVPLSHRVIETLLKRFPATVVGIKDSSGQRDGSLGLAKAFMPPLQVWVGHEPDLQVLAAQGTVGAVSGVANIMPRLVHRLVADYTSASAPGDMARMQQFLAILGGYGLTAALKGIMAMTTGHDGWRRVRAPLVALNDTELARLAEQMKVFALNPAAD